MEYIYFNKEKAKKTKYNGYYCTKTGKVITVKVKGGQGKLDFNKPRLHCTKKDKDGYLEVCISFVNEHLKQVRKYIKIHKLVWETYNGEVPEELTIDHMDNNKYNNWLINLQLLSREDNAVKRSNDWVRLRHKTYRTYREGIYLGIFTRKDLKNLFGITKDDILKYFKNQTSKRLNRLRIVLKENVEDIEKIIVYLS